MSAAEDRIHGLAGKMAQPITRGWLSGSHAYAALAVQAAGFPDPAAVLVASWRTLVNHVAWHRETQDQVRRRIAATVAPMIQARAQRGAILSEAHGINGRARFQLTEDQVNTCVADEVWASLPTPPFRRRHGR